MDGVTERTTLYKNVSCKIQKDQKFEIKNGHGQILVRRYKGLDLRWEGLDKVNRAWREDKDRGTDKQVKDVGLGPDRL